MMSSVGMTSRKRNQMVVGSSRHVAREPLGQSFAASSRLRLRRASALRRTVKPS